MLGKSPTLICACLVFLILDQSPTIFNLILFTEWKQANISIK